MSRTQDSHASDITLVGSCTLLALVLRTKTYDCRMKRRYLSGHSKKKQKEARLENEAKGRRTLNQLNWITVENTTTKVEEGTASTSVLEETPCESGTLPTGEENQVSGQDVVDTDEFTSLAGAVKEATVTTSLQADHTQQPSIVSPSSLP